jgi:uncharacterized protein (TIGR03084 family)
MAGDVTHTMDVICSDLKDEYDELDSMVSGLSHETWDLSTPFFGWTIRDQIGHLSYFDQAACLSATDADGFRRHVESLIHDFVSYEDLHQRINQEIMTSSVSDILGQWRSRRSDLLEAFKRLEPSHRVPWYGPSMSARSSATARLMETWSHGQDIRDALGIETRPSHRLKHVAHLGYATLTWSFENHGMDAPDVPVRLELQGPSGQFWTWGEEGAPNSVSGSVLDFCFVVTQRRHVDDTGLMVRGEVAQKWMETAQAFAGPSEKGPAKGERVLQKNHSTVS